MSELDLHERRRAERVAFEEFMPLKRPNETPDPPLTKLLWDMAWTAWQARADLPPPETTTFDVLGHRVTMNGRKIESVEPATDAERRSPLREAKPGERSELTKPAADPAATERREQ